MVVLFHERNIRANCRWLAAEASKFDITEMIFVHHFIGQTALTATGWLKSLVVLLKILLGNNG